MVVLTNPDVEIEMTVEDVTDKNIYACDVWIVPEDVGGYSSHVVSLPGVSSQGETEEEAVENLKEAFRGAIETYESEKWPIPWSHDAGEEPPPGTKKKRILVDV